MQEWPDWWHWELDLARHLFKRMAERDFTVVDVRAMLEDATGWRPDHEPGRFVVESRHDDRPWEVVVEPDEPARILVVITAYPVDLVLRR